MLTLREIMCLLVVVSEELEAQLVFIFLTFNLTYKVTFISNIQEPHKLPQPVDKTLKTMAIEFAEYQVSVNVFLTTQSYVNIASISIVPRTIGGQVIVITN
ncbi:putative sec23/Sec24, trunk domain, von Willebrand factor A-like domain superfamily [Helianthus anomalus]